ncbi:acyltransferase family protein [Novosphingobium piscinae]|uniref:acyltransferase family protein n=1 Tax=Novosphingobium piscinae TaxID=1507448 RepID=UPI001C8B2528|nr:acyltransferase [Novosphingobium piscinae]
MLDGWRAASILSVLAGHLLPIGPSRWELNAAVAMSGMAIFFCLSGFLITQLLLQDQRIGAFLIRRLARILPLAWLAMGLLAVIPANRGLLLENLVFLANLPPVHLMEGGNHLWSLCVEVQFYVTVAVIVGLLGRRGLYLLPLLALAVTALRIAAGEPHSIVTWHRVDEILAGATLSLLVHRYRPGAVRLPVPGWSVLVLWVLLLGASHPAAGALLYARPYIAAAAVGVSLYASPGWFRTLLSSTPARYVAQISYALYVIHGVLGVTWLGGEEVGKVERYLRRPLLIGATFALAHVSTFQYESRWIALGKRLAGRPSGAPA